MKKLKSVSRIIIGLVFIFSGTVKAIDPLGSAYKFRDYFQAFHIDFLKLISLPLAIILCTAEFIAGFSILTGYRQKTGIWGAMILMLLFTPLTFILALTNPVSDCGCFGDAIHLTNWQTFGKNIILLAFTIILFLNRKTIKQLLFPVKEWAIIFCVISLFILFSFYNLRYLPILDFLPYKTGINIPENMIVPEGMPVDEYETTLIYEKNGLNKEFNLSNYPANDSTWKFADQISRLIKKGYQPPVHDFSITSIDNTNLTDSVLSNQGYSVLMISYKLEEADPDKLKEGFELGVKCATTGIDYYVVTASGTDELKSYNNGLTLCTADETTLKTIIRANPGYVLLKEGTIVGKWSSANVPEKEWFSGDMAGKQLESLNNRRSTLLVISIALSFTVILLLLRILLNNKLNEEK